MLRLVNTVSQVTIHVCCQFCILKIQDRFYPIFSSLENFGFKLPPHLRCMKIQRKFAEVIIFLQCNGMQGMFKLENIVLQLQMEQLNNHCKLKQGGKKILFNLNTLIGFTKVSHIFMRNKKLHYLLNSRRKNSLNISLFVVFIILIMQYVAWQR